VRENKEEERDVPVADARAGDRHTHLREGGREGGREGSKDVPVADPRAGDRHTHKAVEELRGDEFLFPKETHLGPVKHFDLFLLLLVLVLVFV